MTTFFHLLRDRFWRPVAHPIALPEPACLGAGGAILVRFLPLGLLGCRPDRKTGPRVRLRASEALAAHSVEVDHERIRQAVGKLRRRLGLLTSGEPRERGYRVEDRTWEARRARSSARSS